MRAVWTGSLAFGQVRFPVRLVLAASSANSPFRLLHRPCSQPIRQVRSCPSCRAEVGGAELVLGAEFATGRFVTFDQGELERALEDDTISLERFIAPTVVPPWAVAGHYWLLPRDDRLAEEAYALVAAALASERAAGLGRVVLNRRELPCMVVATDDGLLALRTLYRAGEVRTVPPPRSPPDRKLLQLAREVIASRRLVSFRLSRLDRIAPARLPELIKVKADGGQVHTPSPTRAVTTDLGAALRASVRRRRG